MVGPAERALGRAPGARAARRAAAGGPPASTPTPRSAPTRCGSPSSGSTSTRPRSASSPRPTPATATPSGRPSWGSSAERGKMQNPVTGSGGMLIGVVDAVGPESPLGLAVGAAGGHPGLAHADAAARSPTGSPAGTAGRSRCPPRGRRSSSPAPSPPYCPTTCADRGVAGGARRLRRPGRHRAGGRAGRGALGRRPRCGREVRLPQPGRGPRRGGHRAHRPGARRRRGGCAARRRAGRPGGRRRRHRPARRRGRRRHACRRHRRLRGRARRRARGRPGHGGRGHRGLLLHGHLVRGGGPGRGGDGGGRDDAGGQRLHAGARRPGAGAVPLERRASAALIGSRIR